MTAQTAQIRPGIAKVWYDPAARTVDQLVQAGVFSLDGFTPMEVGKLNRHTEQMARFHGFTICKADMYWQLAADASTVKFIRNGIHMVGDPDGAGTEVGDLAYRALAIPEHGDDATATDSQNTISGDAAAAEDSYTLDQLEIMAELERMAAADRLTEYHLMAELA